jgi:hypothetical protein
MCTPLTWGGPHRLRRRGDAATYLNASGPYGGVAREQVAAVERQLAILAGEDESERKRRRTPG